MKGGKTFGSVLSLSAILLMDYVLFHCILFFFCFVTIEFFFGW